MDKTELRWRAVWAMWYRGFLRQMKRLGITVEDMPQDVAEAMLAHHQNALLVADEKRKAKKRK